ncbi:YafY family protein [uncultured Shewanella sp.]|uniref:helix-turn-helix transcriptional regulator n=1 Tax=uncultured Shewanella sp. TaxID=173975 RepID=UPI002629A28A|nr:YafY family protein [uncultured Shewanella sp.]
MTKSERLLALLTLLRTKRYAVTAVQLAEALEVSERTIYRDIQALMHIGVPIEGEAGVGYLLGTASHLPPLMFTDQELVALELGMRMVRAWSDDELAIAAQSASNKLVSVLPDKLKQQVERFSYLVPNTSKPSPAANTRKILRHAIDRCLKVEVGYCDVNKQLTLRCLQPLGQILWGHMSGESIWTLVAWCELREAYRHFRIDRILQITVLDETFELTDNKSLEDYIHQQKSHI